MDYFKLFFQREKEDEDNRETEDEETEITPAPPPQVGAAQALAAKHAMAPPQAPKAAQPKKRKTNQMMAEEAYGVMNRLEKKIGERDHCEVGILTL